MTGYRWDFASVFGNWQILAQGLVGTFQLAALSLGAGLLLGLLVGAGRYSRNRLLHWPATAYV